VDELHANIFELLTLYNLVLVRQICYNEKCFINRFGAQQFPTESEIWRSK